MRWPWDEFSKYGVPIEDMRLQSYPGLPQMDGKTRALFEPLRRTAVRHPRRLDRTPRRLAHANARTSSHVGQIRCPIGEPMCMTLLVMVVRVGSIAVWCTYSLRTENTGRSWMRVTTLVWITGSTRVTSTMR